MLTPAFAVDLMRAMPSALHTLQLVLHPLLKPRPGVVVAQLVPTRFFLPGIGLAWDWTTDRWMSGHPGKWKPQYFPESVNSEAPSAMVLGLSCNQPRPLGSQPRSWTLSFLPSLFAWRCTELLEWGHLMTQMKTRDQVKGWGITVTLTVN